MLKKLPKTSLLRGFIASLLALCSAALAASLLMFYVLFTAPKAAAQQRTCGNGIGVHLAGQWDLNTFQKTADTVGACGTITIMAYSSELEKLQEVFSYNDQLREQNKAVQIVIRDFSGNARNEADALSWAATLGSINTQSKINFMPVNEPFRDFGGGQFLEWSGGAQNRDGIAREVAAYAQALNNAFNASGINGTKVNLWSPMINQFDGQFAQNVQKLLSSDPNFPNYFAGMTMNLYARYVNGQLVGDPRENGIGYREVLRNVWGLGNANSVPVLAAEFGVIEGFPQFVTYPDLLIARFLQEQAIGAWGADPNFFGGSILFYNPDTNQPWFFGSLTQSLMQEFSKNFSGNPEGVAGFNEAAFRQWLSSILSRIARCPQGGFAPTEALCSARSPFLLFSGDCPPGASCITPEVQVTRGDPITVEKTFFSAPSGNELTLEGNIRPTGEIRLPAFDRIKSLLSRATGLFPASFLENKRNPAGSLEASISTPGCKGEKVETRGGNSRLAVSQDDVVLLAESCRVAGAFGGKGCAARVEVIQPDLQEFNEIDCVSPAGDSADSYEWRVSDPETATVELTGFSGVLEKIRQTFSDWLNEVREALARGLTQLANAILRRTVTESFTVAQPIKQYPGEKEIIENIYQISDSYRPADRERLTESQKEEAVFDVEFSPGINIPSGLEFPQAKGARAQFEKYVLGALYSYDRLVGIRGVSGDTGLSLPRSTPVGQGLYRFLGEPRSELLKNMLSETAAKYDIPVGVLAGVARIEGGAALWSFTDSQVQADRSPNCSPNACSAAGPMQFTTGGNNLPFKNGKFACGTEIEGAAQGWFERFQKEGLSPEQARAKVIREWPNEWARWGEGDVCSIKNSLEAAAKKLKNDAGSAPSSAWSCSDQVQRAGTAYYGECTTTYERLGDRNYCQYLCSALESQ